MLELGKEKDATLMRVDTTGEKDRRKVKYTYQMVDFFDEDKGITSMARATAFPGAIVALMLARGEIGGKGFIPPKTPSEKTRSTSTSPNYLEEAPMSPDLPSGHVLRPPASDRIHICRRDGHVEKLA